MSAPRGGGGASGPASNSGVKVSYIVSASKNIKVNADQNISIKELIANKDRVDKTPYFQLAYNHHAGLSGANERDIGSGGAGEAVLSDSGGKYITSASKSSHRKNVLVNKSLGVVVPPQVMRVDQVA